MKIGIFVRKQNIFSNGAGQNCIFMAESLRALGHDVNIIDDIEIIDYKLVIFGNSPYYL